MIEIDGSHGEGGGALLRQALGLAAHAGAAIRVTDIRAGRDEPGLKPQHVKAVQVAGAVCGARVRGATLGSKEITFEPGAMQPGRFELDIGTAGSTTLLLQTVLLPCLRARGEFRFELVGGTDVPWSPQADYLAQVTFPALRVFGLAELEVRRRGYYPKGGGRIRARLAGGSTGVGPLRFIEPGVVEAIQGISHSASVLRDRSVAERQADAAEHMLERLGHPVEIEVRYSDTAGPGCGITLWTRSSGGPAVGGSALGERGVPADEVGRRAARALLQEMESDAPIDRHLADQLIPFLATTGGVLRTSDVTSHTLSNIYVAEQIVGANFRVEGLTVTAER